MKHLTTKILIFFLFILVLVSAYNYFKKPFLNKLDEVTKNVVVPTPSPTLAQKKELDIRGKIAQLLMVPIDLNDLDQESSSSASMIRFVNEYHPGFVIYFGENISSDSAMLATKNIYSQFGDGDYIPLIAVDHEGGSVQRLNGDGFSKLESWQKVVETYSTAQQKAVFNQSAVELKNAGINIVFAPVVDLASNSAILKTRVASNLDKTYAGANVFINSFSQNGIMPVIKHFPGIGSVNKDLHKAVATISLEKEDTEIFTKLLNKFTNIGVMTTHVRIENKLSGKVCSLSEECIGKFAEFYPNVMLFTDDLSMKSALSQLGTNEEKTIEQVAIEAIDAGNNVLVFGKGVSASSLEKVIFALQKEYEDSDSFKKKIDNSVQKILNLKK